MAQKTNLNVSPYYDDFNSEKNFYKVLYKPGFPVQSRELTSSQSILQDQVENFGNNIFKDGSVVIPGAIAYDGNFQAVKLNSVNYGVDISLYIKDLIGKKIIGQTSGISALVKHVVLSSNTNVDYITIYVNYLSSGNDAQLSAFNDGELLSCEENIVYGNTTISKATPFASTIPSNSTSIGSAAYISKGVYFIRGYFVNVSDQTLILDYYTNSPSYRVGLRIDETIVGAKDDSSLYDNAKGFSNYASPGADRLKINLVLTKKLLSDQNDTDFVELMRVDDGKIKIINSKTEYNIVRDWIAERTYNESGDYTVSPFNFSLHNSLNDNLGNGGLFFGSDKTEELNTPSDDLMCLKISSGKAYVKGYDIEKVGTKIIDVEKPREVGIKSEVAVNFNMGDILKVNSVIGLPKEGEFIELYDSPFGDSEGVNNDPSLTGNIIGSARCYSFSLEDAAYTGDSTTWELRLFDIQTNTSLVLNQSISLTDLPKGSFVKGKNSGASGYAVGAGNNSTTIDLNQTSGSFATGEQIQINGIDFPRTIGTVTSYNTQNIKAVRQTSSNPSVRAHFRANAFLERFRLPNNITNVEIVGDGSTATVTSPSNVFTGLRKGSLVRYTRVGFNTETYNKVDSVGSAGTCLFLSPVSLNSNIPGVYDGSIENGTVNVDMFAGAPIIKGSGSLYSPLENANISSVNLDNARLKITKEVSGLSVDASSKEMAVSMSFINEGGITVDNSTFESFDQERYSVCRQDGVIESISNDAFRFGGSNSIIIGNLKGGEVQNVVNTSISKNEVQSKIKDYNRSKVINIEYSKYPTSGDVAVGLGASTLPDGLTYDKRYGLRVQDEEVSLNYPDVVKFLAVYESVSTSIPTLDTLEFNATVDVQNNAVIGENIIGESNQIARVVSKPEVNKLGVVYLNSNRFKTGELAIFSDSSIKTTIVSAQKGIYKDITSSFKLDKGQRDQYYDYSRLVRNSNVPEPNGKLLVVFDYYSTTNEGDIFTALSYDGDRYSTDIPNIGNSGIRATDTIDFRPRVPVYDLSNTYSPFDFSSRDFSNSITHYLTPNESSIIGYDYYLPRIDKVYLNKFGDFIYEKGISSSNPKEPVRNDDLMELATLKLPPYLYNPQNAFLSLIDNRRYTMRDIGKIDDRVSNLEEVTSLSLLEVNAQTLQIQDALGRSRFKTGFFVDSFRDYSYINRRLSSIEINPIAQEITPFRSRNTLSQQLMPKESTISSLLDFNTDFDLFDSNVRKTGNAVTLDYKEVEWISQPYATEIINVNPYELPAIGADVSLTPRMDIWTTTIQLEDDVVRQSGVNRTDTLNFDFTADTSTLDLGNMVLTGNTEERVRIQTHDWQRRRRRDDDQTIQFNHTFEASGNTSIVANGTASATLSNIDTTIQNRLITSEADDFIRSRNIEYVSSGFPEYTQLYLWVDGQRIFDVIPKLLQITQDSAGSIVGSDGIFEIGEEVEALDDSGNVIMTFRLCRPDHKSGAFNNPDSTYPSNPYSRGADSIPTSYTNTSPFLNIDTKSLAEEAQGKYFGYLEENVTLFGLNSKATAYVKNLDLITDGFGDLIGSFFLRDPYSQPSPVVKINTGEKNVRLSTSIENLIFPPGQNPNVVVGDATYNAVGTIEEWQNLVTQTRNTTTFSGDSSININANVTGNVISQNTHTVVAEYTDPLAQTFVVGGNVLAPSAVGANNDLNGAFITSVEVYFSSIDTVSQTPVRCEIRTVTDDSRPSRTIIGSKTLYPTKVDAGGNVVNVIEFDPISASKPTKFTFPEPVYLSPGASYAVVLVAEKSVNYTVWTGRHGEPAVNSQSIPGATDGASLRYSTQYGSGAIFKSQNGAIWTEDQTQDMTFRLYKAEFTSLSGSVLFSNPDLDESNGYVTTLNSNAIQTLPKTGSIGISTVETTETSILNILKEGRKIAGNGGSNAIISGVGCSVTTIDLNNAGLRYETDTSVDTYSITGQGSGLKLNISATDGVIQGTPTIIERGTGYKVGDIVGIVTSSVSSNTGNGAEITITGIGGIDTLYLENIKGVASSSFPTGNVLKYYADDNTLTSLGKNILNNSQLNGNGVNSGNYMKIRHFNHGMYSDSNLVSISDIETDTSPTTLTSTLNSSETATISVASTSQFVNFEGIPVSGINTGYVKIGREIIGYQSVGTGVLNIANTSGNIRGVDGSGSFTHSIENTPVEVKKYELNGVSIRRLVLDSSNVSNSDLDSYHISFDRSKNGLNRNVDDGQIPQLSFNNNAFVGGSNIKASENIMFGGIVPRYQVITPTGISGSSTNINASVRTISGTSVSGNENSFNDQGYENIQLNTYNAFDSVRLVTSKDNENQYLSDIPRNKSFTSVLNFESNTKDLSPIVYLSESNVEFINSRLNNPISDYSSDNRVNSILDDPHSAVYVSNPVRLSKPGTSLKVLFTAYRHSSANIRVLYSLITPDSSEIDQSFQLFPGYNNLLDNDDDGFGDIVVDESKNDGLSDAFVPSSLNNQYLEYQYTVDNLPEFTGYVIKVVMSGTNQAEAPRIREFRSIAVR